MEGNAEGAPKPVDVFGLIHEVSKIVKLNLDTALTWDQLSATDVNYTTVRPLVSRLLKRDPAGIVYALMVNRIQFLSMASNDLVYAPLQTSRASLCELLAMKLLREFSATELELVGVLTRPFCPFQGASDEIWAGLGDERDDIEEDIGNALEMAIVSSAKHFLSTPLVQHLITLVHSGQVVYLPHSTRSLIQDTYRSEATQARLRRSSTSAERGQHVHPLEAMGGVYTYDPFEAGWLDHGRLRVPRWRDWLEFQSFAGLLALFVWTLSARDADKITFAEAAFVIYTLGFTLDEFAASKEHGWQVYTAAAWNAFDLTFISLFVTYFLVRILGLVSRSADTSTLAFDILACGACILFPRLAFFAIKDNVVILALKAMIADFVGFMGIAIVCFSGVLFTLWTLGRGTWTVKQIAWLMLQIWFGSSYLGFSASTSFHPLFGPILLVMYAALSNTLLITILISILSNRFAEINANAQLEHLFQKAVSTIEGVKGDILFSYMAPLNLVAFVILLPLSWICSPRTLHRINVFGIRATAFPLLIAISAYERRQFKRRQLPDSVHLRSDSTIDKVLDSFSTPGLFDSFLGPGSEGVIGAVFEAMPDSSLEPDDLKTTHLAVPTVEEPAEDIKAQRTAVPSTPPAKARGTEAGPSSPLSRLFGKTKVVTRSSTLATETAPNDEIETLRAEMREMRECQARMEDLLRQFVSADRPSSTEQ